jgi:2-keto-4-pentenoate hydratase/2-oxohepta-3-ene-1,7-dioic acid hydratase in catechol pathway
MLASCSPTIFEFAIISILFDLTHYYRQTKMKSTREIPMRFMVGQNGDTTSVYLIKGDDAFDLTAKISDVGTDLSALTANPGLVESVAMATDLGDPVAVQSITPALPIQRPPTIICLGLNYIEHIKEGGYDIPDYPALFMRSANSIMAAGAPMVRPTCSERLDYEAELMLIIGKGGRHISEEDALDHVFGYTVFNDGSVRDYQRKTHQWTPGKNFDATGAIGPHVVTPHDLPAGAAGLKIESRVGTEILQSSNTANMIWSAAKAIAIISEYTTLAPGDHIALGTPPGVGHAKKPNPRWLIPGETVEIEIETIGICASPIVDEADMTTAQAAE